VRQCIETLTRRRSRDPALADVVSDTDSPRDGIHLERALRRILGKYLAFLTVGLFILHTSGSDVFIAQTPNFARKTIDIDPSADIRLLCSTAFMAPFS
jgi:hypothetical protein